MDWSYSNAGLWQRVYEYLDRYDTADHRLVGVKFSLGLWYRRDDMLSAIGLVYYPTIKLVFRAKPDYTPTISEQWFW